VDAVNGAQVQRGPAELPGASRLRHASVRFPILAPEILGHALHVLPEPEVLREIAYLPSRRGFELETGTFLFSRGGAGGSPVTSRISSSSRVSCSSRAWASASSASRCFLRSRRASSWLSSMMRDTSSSMALAVSSLKGLSLG
jgi:hypothetical protein